MIILATIFGASILANVLLVWLAKDLLAKQVDLAASLDTKTIAMATANTMIEERDTTILTRDQELDELRKKYVCVIHEWNSLNAKINLVIQRALEEKAAIDKLTQPAGTIQ